MCAETPDYKATLNLPKTDFPMRAGLPKREPGWLERWEKIGVYDRLREKEGREPFTLHDGPPYANGNLHIGHALNKTIKDMIVRSHQMMGYDARYIPGWDCHGLPIEWKIEEQYRKKGRDKDQVPINEFRAECRDFAAKWVDVQREEFKRLGITGNWENPYLTMDFHAERVIAEEFMKFLMNGTLYQGSKPVMWSPVEKTALAEAEVEYHDKESHTIWVKFKVEGYMAMDAGPPSFGDEKLPEVDKTPYEDLVGAYVVIWTTTPWTIPSNKAVVFGDDISYGLYRVTDVPNECWANVGDQYLLADELAAEVFAKARLNEGQWERVRDVSAHVLKGLCLKHPLAGVEGANGEWDDLRDFRAADFVTSDEGTGFVHCAPSHGLEEYELYRDLGMLPQVITYNVMEDGRFRDDLPFFGGKAILKPNGKEGNANSAIIDKLVEVGGLLARGKIKHSYPHSWRSKAPVIYRNTPQWFAAIDKEVGDGLDQNGTTIRERALTCIDKVNWVPKSGRNRLHSMMEARPDWVLSRQRAWGVPLTCFVRKGVAPTDENFLLRNDAVNQRIVEAFEAEGADAWYAEGAKERFLSGIVDPAEFDQVTDILDVWFDSGSTHAFTLRDREDGTEDGIADVYMEGTDQHRGWFHSSLLQSVGTTGRAPYRNVVTHGFTLDAKGMKMSKSIGNTIVPEKIVQQYGADILRLWVAQTDYTADQRIGDEILKGVADSYRRLRNTMRYMLGALSDFSEADRVDPAEMPELEQWVLHRVAELDKVVRDGFARFDFQGVFQAVFTFATVDLSAFYFDIRKDALYCDGDTLRRRAARTVLDILFHRLTTWLAPVLVFTMEEVWLERFPGDDSSVHLVDMPETPEAWLNPELAAKWAKVRAARRVVTAALEVQRTEKVIGASLEAAPVVHVDDAAQREALESVSFEDVSITSDITVTGDPAPAEAFRMPETDGVAVVFEKAEGAKCGRCWKVLPDVGTHEYPGVCGRCDEAVREALAEA
ncbi:MULTISPECIES: isoleucine--tRNA ligase [Sulfitobacter]|uniref:isoleucine--tRNA ligase n=1 Tax=Sulfitobacter TaxID=60136 RepID=UPI00230769D5|nr:MULTISPECIES: isoleucine--tRNA ligase [Sulfitobacter]MDF3383524.1 isoleucine--tRNA ligase [Sulfitobacter sp. Ks11]MDF3386942.1 isoleucine--tRNA ligase [Sulfitobacter sp. M85]MDF3390362.1 isoleucine--tRNA ligase [Sulfitobacter sp. Ks16]MDF3400999.1 isoleucine--tRNA ligase [Sulfitobacter sp. KE39]MDF3404420.1 isoleucine--tRNA ligase [Sulfitobacter sp. Ks35]